MYIFQHEIAHKTVMQIQSPRIIIAGYRFGSQEDVTPTK